MNSETILLLSLSILSTFISVGTLVYILFNHYSKPITNNRYFEHVSKKEFMKHLNDEKLFAQIRLPTRATKNSAGYDIYSTLDFILRPGEEILLPTGWKVSMNRFDFLMILPRSGLGFKFYSRLANTVGIIDSDYFDNSTNEGHVMLKLRNEGEKEIKIKAGEGVAQAIFVSYSLTQNDFVKGVRTGGFGSTTSN